MNRITDEEAIRTIENRFDIMDYCENEQLSEALDMAVSALRERVIETSSENETKRYLIYVNHYDIFTNGAITTVYEYEGDVFHAMGEILYRSEVQVYRITYTEYTEAKVKYWTDQGYTIRKWVDKY